MSLKRKFRPGDVLVWNGARMKFDTGATVLFENLADISVTNRDGTKTFDSQMREFGETCEAWGDMMMGSGDDD